MRISFALLTVFILTACHQGVHSPIAERLNTSDSVVVQFYSEKQVLQNAATSANPGAIRQLAAFLDGKQTDSASCLKSGQLIFFADKKEIQRIIYKINCRQFEFTINGKKQFTAMPESAVKYMDAIAKGER